MPISLNALAMYANVLTSDAILDKLRFSAQEGWHDETGFRYCDLTLSKPVDTHAPGFPVDEASVELIVVESEIKPHYHNKSESVILVTNAKYGDEAFFRTPDGREGWIPVKAGQMIVIPPGAPHGFRSRHQSRAHPFEILVLSSPAVDEEDTVYI